MENYGILVYFIGFFVIINIFAYAIMCIDKYKSIYQKWRISEKTLFLIALFGGVFGVWLGMQMPLYHKAGKNIFRVGIPIIALLWVIVLMLLI